MQWIMCSFLPPDLTPKKIGVDCPPLTLSIALSSWTHAAGKTLWCRGCKALQEIPTDRSKPLPRDWVVTKNTLLARIATYNYEHRLISGICRLHLYFLRPKNVGLYSWQLMDFFSGKLNTPPLFLKILFVLQIQRPVYLSGAPAMWSSAMWGTSFLGDRSGSEKAQKNGRGVGTPCGSRWLGGVRKIQPP